MKRDEVKSKLESVIKQIEEIENKRENDVVVYVTKDKHFPGHGFVCEVETVDELVDFQQAIIDSQETNSRSDAIKMLGVSESELPETKQKKIYGLLPKHWNQDLMTRLAELREEIKYGKLVSAREKLEKYLSVDDKFAIDMEGIDELV
jgi:hypothetical protein